LAAKEHNLPRGRETKEGSRKDFPYRSEARQTRAHCKPALPNPMVGQDCGWAAPSKITYQSSESLPMSAPMSADMFTWIPIHRETIQKIVGMPMAQADLLQILRDMFPSEMTWKSASSAISVNLSQLC